MFRLNSDDPLAHYDYLACLSLDRWAWEYLRRNHDWRCEAIRTRQSADQTIICRRDDQDRRNINVCEPQARAEGWGLVFFPDPTETAYDADVIWSQAVFPSQVQLHCQQDQTTPICDLKDELFANHEITIVTDLVGHEYILLRWHRQVVQALCTGLSLRGPEPVQLGFCLSHSKGYRRALMAFQALIEAKPPKQFDQFPLWTKQTQILRNGLIVLDAHDQGLTRREMAELLYGVRRIRAEWRTGTYRTSLRYLYKKAEALRRGGLYEKLLGRKWAGPLSRGEREPC